MYYKCPICGEINIDFNHTKEELDNYCKFKEGKLLNTDPIFDKAESRICSVCEKIEKDERNYSNFR